MVNLLTNVLPSFGFCILSVPHQSMPPKLETILVLGCDSGHEFPILQQYFRQVVGIELSLPHCQIALNDFDRKTVVCGDMDYLPFSNNSFDVVYSAHVLEHSSNGEQVLKEIHRTLKENGRVCSVTPHITLQNGDPEPAHKTKLNIKEWQKIYKKCGFRILTSYFGWSLNCDELFIIAIKEKRKWWQFFSDRGTNG